MDIKIIKCIYHLPVLRVLDSTATCEVTAVFCQKCNKQLSEPQTEF